MLGSVVGERVGGESAQPSLHVVGDRAEAFRHLIDRDLDGAYRLAAVILNDRLEAEDAVQDAAETAWRRWQDLRDPALFEAWFRRILVNGCRDRLRARSRRRIADVGRELTEAEHPREADPTRPTEVRDAVDRAMELLGPDERLIVVLRFHADMTVPVIAATVGIPEGTVKSRLHHALRRLRTALEEADR